MVQECNSNWRHVTSEVLQGSLVGPLFGKGERDKM